MFVVNEWIWSGLIQLQYNNGLSRDPYSQPREFSGLPVNTGVAPAAPSQLFSEHCCRENAEMFKPKLLALQSVSSLGFCILSVCMFHSQMCNMRLCLAYQWPRGPQELQQKPSEHSGSSLSYQLDIFKALSGCLTELTWTSLLRSQD